jgi:cysteine synthase A
MQQITQAEPEEYFVVNQFVSPHNPEVHYVLDVTLVDMVFTVSNEEAIETTHRLSKEEGLLVGTSSGANVFAALQMDNGRNRVVTIWPNRAERYFSTALL